MRITVIGSTGHTGRHVLDQGLGRGHEMVAFTRRPETLPDPSEVTVVSGDGRDRATLSTALTGSSAAIAIVGGGRGGPHHAAAVATALVAAMTQAGVRRLVTVSAYPVAARRPRIPVAIIRRVFAAVYADLAAMEEVVTASGLDWAIVRPGRLTDGPRTGRTTLDAGELRRVPAVSRADLASVLLDRAQAQGTGGGALNLAGGRGCT